MNTRAIKYNTCPDMNINTRSFSCLFLSKQALKVLIVLMIITIKATGQDAPCVIISSTVSDSATISVPIRSVDFENISSVNLKLSYNSDIAEVVAVTKGADLPGMYNINLTEPGTIIIGWYTSPAATTSDSTVMFWINFKKRTLGDLSLTFVDDGYSCIFSDMQFRTLNDQPYEKHFYNGIVKFIQGDPLGIHEHDVNAIKLKAYPNPFIQDINISFYSKSKSEATINLYDITGLKIMQRKYQSNAGENNIPINLGNMKAAFYLVEVILGNGERGVVRIVGASHQP